VKKVSDDLSETQIKMAKEEGGKGFFVMVPLHYFMIVVFKQDLWPFHLLYRSSFCPECQGCLTCHQYIGARGHYIVEMCGHVLAICIMKRELPW
jgi:hypothetical protein